MYIDAITLATLADEWRLLLARARIDTIIQPTEHSLALQCYTPGQDGQGGQNRWLYLSAHPQLARAHITARKPTKIASEPPPFVMLLRKYLEGTRVEAVEQPRWERILEIIASHPGGSSGDERIRYRLILEIMGRMSNLILCDEQGLILGSLKQVGSDVNRYRVISAHVQYVPPPPQQRDFLGQSLPRLEPTIVTASQLALIPGHETPAQPQENARKSRSAGVAKLWQLLTRNLLGFSPLLAREAVYRTLGNTESPVDADASEDMWEELAWNVRDLASLYESRQWQPELVERVSSSPGGSPLPVAFAAYPLTQYAEQPDVKIRKSPSLNVLIDDYYAGSEWRDAMGSVRAPIKKVLQNQRDRCKRKAEILREEMAATAEASRYRLHAELLLAHQNEVTQGATTAQLENYYASESAESILTIPLDPRFDAVGNANRLFNKYHKLRRALALIPGQIEQNEAELATVEQLQADLDLAENPPEVLLVKAEVQAAGYLRGKPVEKKGKRHARGKGKSNKPAGPGGGVPLSLQSRKGFTILVGKNSRQNEEVTFHQATAHDLWLHARGIPGAHVIIKAGGREVPHDTLEQAASLAAYYSQARGSTSVLVDYTLQRYVRHMKNGGPGMVIYEHEKTIYGDPSAFTR